MKLRETILAEHSKKQVHKIVQWVGNNPERFNQLLTLFLNDEYRVVQRASSPLSYVVINQPHLIKAHYGKLLKNLTKEGIHDAVKRNTIRILQDIELPVRYHGQLMNLCFNYIINPVEKPAIKAFSLTVLHKLSIRYPAIKQELKTIIEERWDYESPAFRSRAKKILKEFS